MGLKNLLKFDELIACCKFEINASMILEQIWVIHSFFYYWTTCCCSPSLAGPKIIYPWICVVAIFMNVENSSHGFYADVATFLITTKSCLLIIRASYEQQLFKFDFLRNQVTFLGLSKGKEREEWKSNTKTIGSSLWLRVIVADWLIE